MISPCCPARHPTCAPSRPGDKLTLLAYNGMVAGAVGASAAKSTTVGTVKHRLLRQRHHHHSQSSG